MNETVSMILVGAFATGGVGLLFFFVTQYFTNREDDHKETRSTADTAKTGVVELKAIVELQTKIILETRDDVKFLRQQMAKVFDFIDAPPRATDKRKGNSL